LPRPSRKETATAEPDNQVIETQMTADASHNLLAHRIAGAASVGRSVTDFRLTMLTRVTQIRPAER
jgi:hypothetical protein